MALDHDRNGHWHGFWLSAAVVALALALLHIPAHASHRQTHTVPLALIGLQQSQADAGQQDAQSADQKDTGQTTDANQTKGEGAAQEGSADEDELDPVARQGIPKEPLPSFILLQRAAPLVKERPKLDEMRRLQLILRRGPSNPDEEQLLRKLVSYQILRLSDPREFSRQRRNLEEIGRMLQVARQNPQVYAIVRDVVLACAEQMFQHHIVSRVAAGIVLGMLADEAALPMLVQQLNDPKQHESVKIWCIKAIRSIALAQPELRIRNKQYEQEVLQALLRILRQEQPPHLWTQREIILALGAVGRPTEDLLAGDANVARELVLLLRGTGLRSPEGTVAEGPGRAVRVAATRSLAMLVIPPTLDYNFQIVGTEIARFAVEAAYAALRDPLIDRLKSDLYVRRCYYAIVILAGDPSASAPEAREGAAAQHPMARQHADPEYLRQLRDLLGELNQEMLRVYRPPATEVDPKDVPKDLIRRAQWVHERLKSSQVETLATRLLEHMQQHPPRGEGRLTPATEPLPPPPQLKPPAAKTAAAEESGSTTDGVSSP